MTITTWADGFGRWHAVAPTEHQARRGIVAEILEREPRAAVAVMTLERLAPNEWAEQWPDA